MAQNWYYARGNQQFGPVALEQLVGLLASGQVQQGDLVWADGMAEWAPASTVPELSPKPAPVAPNPMPVNPATSSPIAANPYATNQPSPPAAWPNPPITSPFTTNPVVNNPPWPTQPGTPGMLGYHSTYGQELPYAGFWMRFAAFIIDVIITAIAGAIVGAVIGGIAGAGGMRPNSPEWGGVAVLIQVISQAIQWLYFAFMESSPNQATLGKMAVGLKVTDAAGQRIGFGRATGRYFGKFISWLIMGIGFMMAGWTEKKQALHDIMAGTLVVKKGL